MGIMDHPVVVQEKIVIDIPTAVGTAHTGGQSAG